MSETPLILIEIRSKYHELDPAMKQVANFFINNYDKSVYMSLREIAKASNVSDASVTRFIKKLGFKTFKSFQVEVAKSINLQTKNDLIYGEVMKGDSTSTICKKVFKSNIQIMQDTLRILDFQLIEEIASMIMKARNVLFYSQGRSTITAMSGRLRFYRLGINCVQYVDPHEQAVSSCMVGERDVVIGISNYGRSSSVVRNIKRARDNGAKTIGITSAKDSPLAQAAEYVIYSASNTKNNENYEPSCENVAHIVIMDCIYMMMFLKESTQALDGFYRATEALNEERM